ncbi:NADH-quinone oxidoreductase subunit NuoH [Bacteriovoracaceae bacterium]|nr:NADH-quinone oxidoreductase subunit NuoH [Bacteriovoracaceae bacterium]|tara:strand:+ start:142220 stop:143416 length:1197 start_codon:yes stop_codon:yes gene_type:complete
MNSTIVSYLSQFEGHKKFISILSEALGFDATYLVAFLVFFLASFIVVNVMALVGGLGTYAERKISADIQMRQGPNRVGPYGLLQFLADGVKMITKEDIIPRNADKLLFTIAPLMALVGVFGSLAVVPFSSGFILTDLNVGVFYLIGVSSLVGVAIFLGGYSSNSKWSMLGGMRGASQIISYEVPVTLSILAIVILAGGLSFSTLVEAQGGMPHQWYILHNPFTFIGFFVFFIGALAETNRAPFDLPEAESELVSGYHTEYTGMRFGFFALAEYIEVFVVCGVAAAAFLGGYKVPFDLGTGDLLVNTLHLPPIIGRNIGQILQVGSFVTKTLVLYYIVIWIRWTFPRLRVDHLMTLCWKYLTPIALFNLVGCAVWLYAFDGQSVWELLSHLGGASSGGH